MKNKIAIALLCLLALSLAGGPKASAMAGVEDQIKKLEQDWAQATVKDGAAAVDQYEADDIISTDPGGRVTDKAQDKKDLSSGDLKFQSLEVSDLRVRVYGDTAVAAGTTTLKVPLSNRISAARIATPTRGSSVMGSGRWWHRRRPGYSSEHLNDGRHLRDGALGVKPPLYSQPWFGAQTPIATVALAMAIRAWLSRQNGSRCCLN